MPDRPTLAVTGATGTIGAHLVRTLARRGVPARAFTRRPDAGQELPGIEWVEADLSDRAAPASALAGVERLFLLTGNSDRMVALQKNALRAAAEAGVLHVVKLSALGASDHSRSLIGAWHRIVEHHLEGAGPAWTILRPHHFMQNFLDQADAVRSEGIVRSATGDGAIPFVDTRDIAEVAAEVLTTPGHGGRTYTLTGPEALTFAKATEILGRAIGRDLEWVEETPGETRRRMEQAGTPDWLISAQLAIAAYQRAGGPTAQTTDTVERLLGRPARGFADFAREHAERFRG